jgi:hypothetical protein
MKLLKLLVCAAVSLAITGCPALFDLEHTPNTRFDVDLCIVNNSTESLWIYFSRIKKEISVPIDNPLTEKPENQISQYVFTTSSLEEDAAEYKHFGGHIEFCGMAAEGNFPSRKLIKVIDDADLVLTREESPGKPFGLIVYTLIVTNEMLGIE